MDTFSETSPQPEAVINSDIKAYLLETAKWGKFLAIIGYILIGIISLIGLFMVIGMSALTRSTNSGYPMSLIGLIYILITAFYYFPVHYLYTSSVQLKGGLLTDNLSAITSGFRNQKSMFKFMGVMTIVVLSIYAFILIFYFCSF